jgi:tripartite-type tricarboxylate transporter receptor subunit TctC
LTTNGSPEELGAHIHSEIVKWAKVVKALDLHVD